MSKIKLTKIESSHNNVRTKETIGEAPILPEIGKSFILFGDSLEFEGGIRTIHTSTIEEIEKITEKELIIKTLNSTYKIEILED